MTNLADSCSASSEEIDIDSLRSAKAIYSFTARNEKELTVKKGEILKVISLTPDNNWWEGIIGDKSGFIPSTYIMLLDEVSNRLGEWNVSNFTILGIIGTFSERR